MSESSTVHSSPIQGSSAPTSIPQESNKMENLAKMTLIETRLSNEKKSVFLAYVLWFFFGSFGVHCFYLGKPMSGLFRIASIWLGIILVLAIGSDGPGLINGVGALFLVIGSLLLLIDIFRIPGFARAYLDNRRMIYERNLLR
jgi:hypothetical protein